MNRNNRFKTLRKQTKDILPIEHIPEGCLAILLFAVHFKDENQSFELFCYGDEFERWISKTTDYKQYVKINLVKLVSYRDERVHSVKVTDRKKLQELLDEYILLFEEDKLKKTPTHYYYSYKNSIKECTTKWQKEYDVHGTSINIAVLCQTRSDLNFRECEMLFSLERRKHVKLSNAEIIPHIEELADIVFFTVEFLNSPEEIYGIYETENSGGIRISDKDGIVYYKKDRIKFHPRSNALKLLCYLHKNVDKDIPIKNIIKELKLPDGKSITFLLDDIRAYKKAIIKKFRPAPFTIYVSKNVICMRLK